MYRILVIEDDHTVRKSLFRTLASGGYECIQAANATSGLKACDTEKPDLVLLDVHLPDGNGIDVCRTIKSQEALRHIPILLITGEASDVDYRVEGLEAGAEDYILKPFSHKELVSRLRGILKSGARPTGA